MPAVWTDAGQAQAVDLLDPATRAGVPATYQGHWGSGTTVPAVAQTALVTPHSEARATVTVSQPAANTARYAFTLTAAGADKVVNEFGIFDAASGGVMSLRATLSSLNLVVGDRVDFTLDLVFKDATE